MQGRHIAIRICLAVVLSAVIPIWAADSMQAPRAWLVEEGTDGVLVEDHRVPLVRIIVEFPVGSWSPWAGQNHAEEAFEIQLHDPAGALRARADLLGLDLSVIMHSHYARVDVSCRREELDEALQLIRDVLANREFDRRVLKRWSRTRDLEWSAAGKDPEFRLEQAAARLLFPAGDPRRKRFEKPERTVTDPVRLLAARDALVRLPGRIIAFAGDLGIDQVEELAVGLLPPAAARAPDGLAPVYGPMTPPDRIPDGEIVTMDRISQVFFAYGRGSPTYGSERYPAFMIADHVLGGHFHSRLYEALRHEGGETYGASTRGRGGVYAEGYALTSYTRPENAEVMDGRIREVLRLFHVDGITEEERADAAGHFVGRRPFSRQSPGQLLERFLWERRNGFAPGFYDELIERAARTPLGEINGFINEYFDPSGFRMLRVEPKR